MVKTVKQFDSVEGIIQNAAPDYLPTLKSNRKRIDNRLDLETEFKQQLLQKIDFAIKRVESPLDLDSKLKYLFIPFEIITLYTDPERKDIDQFKELGFITKIKQYFIFSIIGMVMYISAGIVAAVLI